MKISKAWLKVSLVFGHNFHKTGNMETESVIKALTALSQSTRLGIFRLLAQAGPEGLSAGRIAECLAIQPSSLSFHLKELSNAGLLSSRQDSRYVIYSARFDTMNAVNAYLTENCCGGSPCGSAAAPVCPNPPEMP